MDLAAGYGLSADPWQEEVTGNWLARKRNGRLAAGTCGLAVPRQNGKNAVLEIAELHKMVAQGRRILHTAHEVKTARKAFLRIKSFFENERKHPELAALVAEIRQTNGQEAIVLTNGGSIEFVARSRGSGRGFTVDDLVCDEAQELTDEQLEALMPTISAAPSGDPQVILTGTPPPPGSPGTVFLRIRAEGLAGTDKRLCWDEWSIPDDTDAKRALHDESFAYATNPALGRRLNRTTTDDERKVMSPEGYARERLGKWPVGGRVRPAIAPDVWRDLYGYPETTEDRVAVAVKFSLDGLQVAAAAARGSMESTHVEALGEWTTAEGIQVLADALAPSWRSFAAIVIDGKGGSGVLKQELLDRKVREKVIVLPTVTEVVTAHTMMLTAIEDGTLTHANQAGLNAAVAVAVKRKIGTGGGWAWQAIGEGDVTPLDAATFALWAAVTKGRKSTTGGGWRVVTA